jgi:hypothetical protein
VRRSRQQRVHSLPQLAFTAASGGARFTRPLDGHTAVTATQALTWSTVASAQGYVVVVGRIRYGTDLINSGVLPAAR